MIWFQNLKNLVWIRPLLLFRLLLFCSVIIIIDFYRNLFVHGNSVLEMSLKEMCDYCRKYAMIDY